MRIVRELSTYADMIKIGHTLFALPFALAGLSLAWANGYTVDLRKFIYVLIAFTAARSAAMGFNRVVDRHIDAQNPRTKNRPTANGKIQIGAAKLFTLISVLIFIAAAFLINNLCGWLSFPALAILLGYSYAKRFTAAAHLILGVALSMAPIGAWIAAADFLDPRILALGAALFCQIAAFDIIYALQDLDFDKKFGLHSLPARAGRNQSIVYAGIFLIAAFAFLILNGVLFSMPFAYYFSSTLMGALYVCAIYSVLKLSKEKINDIFFYLNAASSLLILLGTASILL